MRRDRTAQSPERERAVSEVLSYSLIFGLIIASIAIVTVGGVNSLQTAQTNEQLSNAERAFDVLHDNLADVYSEGAPSRATEISLGDSQLFLDENVTFRVKLDGVPEISREIRPLVFRIDGDRQLVYEAGATIRSERDGGIVLNAPPLALDADGAGHAHLPIVRTTSADVQSMGSTTILVRGQSWNREVLQSYVTNGPDLEYVEIETPRSGAWQDYFDQREYCIAVTEPSTDTVRCAIGNGYEDPRHLYVTEQAIEISLIQ